MASTSHPSRVSTPVPAPTTTASTSPTPPTFPFPSIYSFPPFFTRQPNGQTWSSQLSLWNSLILAYCRFHKIWRVDLNTAVEWDLFSNKEINRSLKLDTCREILNDMVKKGDAEWVSGSGSAKEGKNTSAIIFWRRPEEWANLISDWIDATGQKNAILTLYEISEGDSSYTQGTHSPYPVTILHILTSSHAEFHGIDSTILRKALDVLVRRGQAQIMRSADGEEAGVKFFGVQ
ncbi:ESCRT-II complex subunit-domain-containing protein [Myxozyma melibiosi]|uniref:ESCRT-II complex subunit-domain-containing protein n=1 Tax=Myxozyma melibiosi TaxID=54550 RepID=A0ABR1F007_9ASCO